jgi:hypothetical protein
MPRNAAEMAGLFSADLESPLFAELGLVIDKRAAETPADALAALTTAYSAAFNDYTWARKFQLFVKANNQAYDLVIVRSFDPAFGAGNTVETVIAAAQTATGANFAHHDISVLPGQYFKVGIKNNHASTAMDAQVYLTLHG